MTVLREYTPAWRCREWLARQALPEPRGRTKEFMRIGVEAFPFVRIFALTGIPRAVREILRELQKLDRKPAVASLEEA
jgi:hypothetical protein